MKDTTEVAGPGDRRMPIALPFGAQGGRLEIDFPSDWEVVVVSPPPLPALAPEAIRDAVASPVAGPPLREIARGRRRAAILVDDSSRPTPAGEILPHLLAELDAAGVSREAVTIVIAGGGHLPDAPEAIARKVGADIARSVRVVAHDPDGPVADLGKTPAGTPVRMNALVAACDLKVGVGAILPHDKAGFSGGCKIVAPGICAAETIRALHDRFGGVARPGDETSPFRREAETATALAGLDFVANAVLGPDLRIGALFSGAPDAAYDRGAEAARRSCEAPVPGGADAVVVSAWPFDGSLQYLGRSLWPLREASGKAVRAALLAAPGGMGVHAFGAPDRAVVGRAASRIRRIATSGRYGLREAVGAWRSYADRRRDRFLLLAPTLPPGTVRAAFPRASHFAAWEPLFEDLRRRCPAGKARVAVYPCPSLQYPGRGRAFP